MIKKVLSHRIVTRTLDILMSPLTLLSCYWFKYVRMLHPDKTPITEDIFMRTGVLPIRDHYYQPLINPKQHLQRSLRDDRLLPGIDWNEKEQLSILEQFHYSAELAKIPLEKGEGLHFYLLLVI